MSSRVSTSHLIGRASELAQLQAAVERAAGGTPGVVLLAGDSGVGKSRLTRELAAQLAETDTLVLVGDCVELSEGEIPFAPIVSALRRLERVNPELAQVPRLPQDTGDLGSLGQARLFETLLGVFQRVAAEGPTVAVIEDIHWADRSTRDLLLFLTRSLRDERLLLVLTYRSDELHRRHPLRPFLAQIASASMVERIELEPLSRDEVTEQLAEILGEQPDATLLDAVFMRSEGNPLFTEELVAQQSECEAPLLPTTLSDALLLRVEALSRSAQDVVRVVAVAGRRADHRLLEAVLNMPERDLFDALRDAVERQVLVEADDERSYEFRHALLREAVYQDLLPGERGKLHVDLATAIKADASLANQPSSAASEIAAHWYAAHELDCAFEASIEAGFESERVFAFAEAQLHFERALELWDRVKIVPSVDRRTILRQAAAAAHNSDEGDRAIALARALVEDIDPAEDPEAAAFAYERLGRYLWTAGRVEQAMPAYHQAVEVLPPTPSVARARALAAEGQVLMLRDQPEKALELCDQALPIAREVGAREVEANILNTLLACASGSNDVDKAVELLAEVQALNKELGSAEEELRAYMNGGDALDQAGRVEEALQMALDGIEAASAVGLARHQGRFLQTEAAIRLVRLGRWDEAYARAREVLDSGTAGLNLLGAHEALAVMAMERGDYATAVPLLDEARRTLSGNPGSMWIALVERARARLALREGRIDDARAIVAETFGRLTEGEYVFFTASLYWAGVCAEADAAEQARPRRDEAAVAAATKRADALIARIDGLLSEYVEHPPPPQAAAWRALAWAERGRLDGLHHPSRWTTAADGFEALGQVPDAAYARYRQAEAMASERAPADEVTAVLNLSRATAERLGMAPLLGQIESLARRARLKLDSADGAGPAEAEPVTPAQELGLTNRELEVLELVAAGRTNKEIGTELYMSEKTASVHVSRILSKLAVANRAEAAASAERLGLVRSGLESD